MSSNHIEFLNGITTGKLPLTQNNLKTLRDIKHGFVDLLINYDYGQGTFTIFATFSSDEVRYDIPIVSARGNRRSFKDLHRCLVWGQQMQLRTAKLRVHLAEYITDNHK